LPVLIDTLQGDGLANVRSVTGIDSDEAIRLAGHVAVRNDGATIHKLLADAPAIVLSEQSVSAFLKLEPLIANRSYAAAISDGLDGFNMTRPSDAPADRVDSEASVRACPQPLVQKPSARLIDVVVNARVIDADADYTGDCRANVLND
jgi:hypothetical protein